MTRNVDLRGHPGLKRDECISIHRYYEPTKFHQNRKGSGQLVIDLTWNDPNTAPFRSNSGCSRPWLSLIPLNMVSMTVFEFVDIETQRSR